MTEKANTEIEYIPPPEGCSWQVRLFILVTLVVDAFILVAIGKVW